MLVAVVEIDAFAEAAIPTASVLLAEPALVIAVAVAPAAYAVVAALAAVVAEYHVDQVVVGGSYNLLVQTTLLVVN